MPTLIVGILIGAVVAGAISGFIAFRAGVKYRMTQAETAIGSAEKEAERIDDGHYRLKVRYHKDDETELVIRILSFGPMVKVIEPYSFVELIKNRLAMQKNCGL